MSGQNSQVLHLQKNGAQLHGRPDAFALALAADAEQLVVPVGTKHQREAIRSQLGGCEIDGALQVAVNGILSAIIIWHGFLEEGGVSGFGSQVPHR
ncbi:hypothetical protein D3C71_1728670 [compost metagenome]